MNNLRTGISLAALSLSLTVLASPVLGQERLGRQGILSFGQELDYDFDDGLEARTTFGLNLSSATRTQTLSLNLGTELIGDFTDGADDDFEINNSSATLRYTRQGSNNRLAFSATYRERDLGRDSFELAPGIIIIGEEDGELTATRISTRLETGLEGPFGLRLDASYRDADYENTVNPDLGDEITSRVEALARFSLSRSLELRARAGIADTEEDDALQTESETTFFGLGLGGATANGLTFSADLLFDQTETTTTGGTTTDDGLGFDVSVTQQRQNGSISGILSSRIDEAGRRTLAQVSRELTLPNGGLGLSLGVVDQEGIDDLEILAGVNYTTGTPQASVTVSLQQAATTDDNDTVISTNLSLAYARQIDSVSSWEAQLGYVASDELGSNNDDSETTASVAYRRDLTSDWSMLTGYEYSVDDDGDDENSIFFNIQRDITFGF